MRNGKRVVARILCIMVCAIILLQFTCCFAYAQSVRAPNVKENTFVYDDEGILSSAENEKLNTLLRYLEEKTSVEFAVITTPSFNGISMDDYAHELFNTLGIGKSSKDNGILFLLSAKEGHARLEIGYGLESVLTDSICGRILDNYYVPNRDKGKNVESIIETANGVLAVLGKEYNVDLVDNQTKIADAVKSRDSIDTVTFIIIIIIIFIIFIVVEVASDGSGSGSSSGGGFYRGGGFSSGGGFGGGHSGGGGAGR